MSAVVTPRALKALIRGKLSTEVIWVKVKDPTGHRYFGSVGDMLCTDADDTDPTKARCTILADDGELVHGVQVSRLEWFDVRKRPDGY